MAISLGIYPIFRQTQIDMKNGKLITAQMDCKANMELKTPPHKENGVQSFRGGKRFTFM